MVGHVPKNSEEQFLRAGKQRREAPSDRHNATRTRGGGRGISILQGQPNPTQHIPINPNLPSSRTLRQRVVIQHCARRCLSSCGLLRIACRFLLQRGPDDGSRWRNGSYYGLFRVFNMDTHTRGQYELRRAKKYQASLLVCRATTSTQSQYARVTKSQEMSDSLA